jgi:DNA topoisomerase-1
MEEQLDFVSSGENSDWALLCRTCYNEIKELSKPVAKLEKQIYPIDDTYDFIFEKFGPVIKIKKEDGTFEYKPINKDLKIDLDKLKNRQYTVDELLEIKNNYLGQYEGEDVFIKTGKFGPYIQYGENNKSIKTIKKPLNEITMADIKDLIEEGEKSENLNILRVLSPSMSVRRGKFGAYVFYKTPEMSKPQFLNIKKFPEGYITCDENVLIDWLFEKYHL